MKDLDQILQELEFEISEVEALIQENDHADEYDQGYLSGLSVAEDIIKGE
jgi:hypothetical protein